MSTDAMADGGLILMTTYGIGRGFLLLDSTVVPASERRYAATLDGMDRYARPVTLADLRDLPPIPLLVTGGSAVSANGVRFGKGHGYFDLEWAMLSEIGAVDEHSQVADVVHDCQVVEETLVGEDWIDSAAYVGPLSTATDGSDFSVFTGILTGGVTYWLLARRGAAGETAATVEQDGAPLPARAPIPESART